MLIPYKVKNPPKHFPVTTVTLIALNVFTFALTSHSFLEIRQEVVAEYALRWGESPPITLLSSMFLHGDIFHLLGNMLFLWIFGPAVEDRLGVMFYLGLYLLAGFAGDVAQAALSYAGAIGMSIPSLGASGAIMGVLGAYWYMYSWSPVCVFYALGLIRWGTFELAAIWVIGFYFLSDLVNGFLSNSLGAMGGVANFAHVGGAFTGALVVAALRVKRDSSDVSKVKAAHAEQGNLVMLSCAEMWPLVSSDPDNEELVEQFAIKAVTESSAIEVRHALALNTRAILSRCPEVAVDYLTLMEGDANALSAGDILYIGRWCEANKSPDRAISMYTKLAMTYPDAPENEAALFRSAAVNWHHFNNADAALRHLDALLTRYPNGTMMFEAEDMRDEIRRARAAA